MTDGSLTASKTANAKPLGSVSLPTPPTVPAAKAAGRLAPDPEAVASSDPIRVLIADDHALFRRGLHHFGAHAVTVLEPVRHVVIGGAAGELDSFSK